VRGASVDVDSDLPVGAGVSSSAALECSVALALCSLSGLSVPRPELAGIAKRAENEFAGAPTGIIDQSAALLCEAGHAMLLDCRTRRATQVPFLPPSADGVGAGAVALIIDTRVTHALVSGDYAARRAECEEAARLLRVRALGSVSDLGRLTEIGDPVLRRRARHVITDCARARGMSAALLAGDYAEQADGRHIAERGADIYRYLGESLIAGHASLRDDFEVSWPEADVAVEVAMATGAYGAKMIGGGFGGSVLALVPVNRDRAVRAALTEAYAERGWLPPDFIDAVPSPAARRLR